MGRGYEKRYKVTRILLADYIIIKEFARKAGLSMAETLHRLIAKQVPEAKPIVRPAIQPAFRVPVAIARSTPISTARRRSTPVTASFSREVENVTNGHRQTD